ncbi:MAG: hypothetical protein JWM32_2935 [Verrucomicrobia bacterium]|nr:hypothetical protein [Verrucomicrobiota bacterium]
MKASPLPGAAIAAARLAVVLGRGVFLAAIAHGAPPAVPEKDEAAAPTMMDSVPVEEGFRAQQSFGFAMYIAKDGETQKVRSIHVVAVQPGSDAAKKGLAPRVRINRINGKAVEEFTASFLAGTELNQIFLGRHEGDRVVLEISIPGRAEPKVVTIFQRAIQSDGRGTVLLRF